MTTLERLGRWNETGALADAQCKTISAIVRKQRFSVFLELNLLLYLGVVSFIGGVGWVIQSYVTALGDATIIGGLALILAASFYYCFSRALPYSAGQIESPTLAFDYILYLGCLTFGIEVGYLESRFHLLQTDWEYYLLISAALFSWLAYRVDNRLVLSLALSTLAGWFGIRVSLIGVFSGESLPWSALIYGAIVVAAGTWLYRRNIKKHFTGTYFHVAAIIVLSALFLGIFVDNPWPYVLVLLTLSAASIVGGIRFGRFAFVVYGIGYGYAAISAKLSRYMTVDSIVFGYYAISGALVILAMVVLARRFGREE